MVEATNREGLRGEMRLRVLLPAQTLVDESVRKVVAEAANGSFCLLPRHASFVAALVPGLLSYWTHESTRSVQHYVALDEGVLVKCGSEVRISTRNAVRGASLFDLQRVVDAQFVKTSEHDREVRSALARLEAGVLRRFVQCSG